MRRRVPEGLVLGELRLPRRHQFHFRRREEAQRTVVGWRGEWRNKAALAYMPSAQVDTIRMLEQSLEGSGSETEPEKSPLKRARVRLA